MDSAVNNKVYFSLNYNDILIVVLAYLLNIEVDNA